MGTLSKLEREFDYDIVEEFVNHFAMMCQSIDIALPGLAHPEHYRRSVDDLFRIFHNIKSATAFLRITPINKLCMLAEDVLMLARECKGPASDELIEWIRVLGDQLKTWLDDIEDDNELTSYDLSLIKIPRKLER